MRPKDFTASGLLWTALLLVIVCLSSPAGVFALANGEASRVGASPVQTIAAVSEPAAGEPGALRESVFKWINFLLLFGALVYFLRKPVQEFFAQREAAIRRSLEEARAAKERAEHDLGVVLVKLEQLEQEVAALKSEAATQMEADRRQILTAAQAEAERMVTSAHQEVAQLVKNARKELREYSAELVVQMAEEKIKSGIRPENHGPLFEKFVASLAESDRPKK